MSRRVMVAGVGLAVACAALVSPLSTAGVAAKTLVRIDVAGAPSGGNPDGGSGRFTLTSGGSRDAGQSSYSVVFSAPGTSASGQEYSHVKVTLSLAGKDGLLRVVAKGITTGASGDGAVSGRDVWRGTWTVSGGDGTYAGIRAGGAFVGIAGPGARVAMRMYGHVR